ncbi:hypothetical protein AB3M83_13275 [Microbacterium sp. 179-B 1A2 NHS]|uniref:hypothetical protein n=1 Tax=Microbacterium sp. 179-B 1A2 NHS TaxID=3142383 RepID=UPI0039A38986
MNRRLAWGVGVGLLLAAWGVVQVTPTDDDANGPFVVSAEIGESAVARTFEVTVTDVHLASRVADARGWSAEGTWLVVDLQAEAVRTEKSTNLGNAVLVVDGVTYRASERPASFVDTSLETGIPQRGSLAFELPTAARERSAALQLSGSEAETRLDSLVELRIDLADLEPQDEVEMEPTGWAAP